MTHLSVVFCCSEKKKMSAGFVVCADPDQIGWSATTVKFVALGTEVGIWLSILVFFYPFVRVFLMQHRTLLRVANSFYSWIWWGVVFLLQYAIISTRNNGAWKTGCLQGTPEWSLMWTNINLYGFPDIFLVAVFPFCVLSVYFDILSMTKNKINGIIYGILIGLIYLAYSVSELSLLRMSPEQWAGNNLFAILLIWASANLMQFLKNASPHVFDDEYPEEV